MFHSKDGASYEARELYIKSSGIEPTLNIQDKDTTTVRVLDVGLGLAYNAINTIDTWYSTPTQSNNLNLTSLEIDITLVELLMNKAPWTSNWLDKYQDWIAQLHKSSTHTFSATIDHPSDSSQCKWDILIEDACSINFAQLDANNIGWNFIWQDPFSPTKNPTLWSVEWFKTLKQYSNTNCKLLTYSVARSVKEALSEAGWKWQKFSSPTSTKRHWLKAHCE